MEGNPRIINMLRLSMTMCLAAMIMAAPALADNAVKLRVLIIATGDLTEDMGFAYIKPVLDEMDVQYDALNAKERDLTAAMLASSSTGVACKSEDAGCAGNYNGIILTDSDLVPGFTPGEWEILHDYEKNFGVREAVLSGWPATYSDLEPPYGVYLDYGLVYSSSINEGEGRWTVPAACSQEVFEYVNQANPLPLAGFTFATRVRNDATGLRDGSVPSVVPLLRTQNDEVLVSIVRYMIPSRLTPVREVMISTINQASFLIHSKVLAYEFVNWVTQGVFVGARRIHMAVHLDDLFHHTPLWDADSDRNSPVNRYRLNSADIRNAVDRQAAFRAVHPTAGAFKLDFAFNGSGAVVDPKARKLVANFREDLVAAVIASKPYFRFINHTYTHAHMDKAPVPANAPCDYRTFTGLSSMRAEITRNRTVWKLLGLPERGQNNRVLVTGHHSGLKDPHCTDDAVSHPDMFNVQADDLAFDGNGANPLFLRAAASTGVAYVASDSSQHGQDVEQYITQYDDGSPANRVMLPRWPTNVFFNVATPFQLEDEYNYLYHWRFVNAGQNPCEVPGAACVPRSYAEILRAEADIGLRHMLGFGKWPHFFHQANLARYDESGNTLQFDWLNATFTEYERLVTLPVRNYPYYLIGDYTAERLNAKSASIRATWNRTTNRVTLAADRTLRHLPVTGLSGGELYGGQFIREVTVNTRSRTFEVNRALSR